jgi:hypothetical protein
MVRSNLAIPYLRRTFGPSSDKIFAVTIENIELLPRALTRLSEDERLFKDSVYEFADREIRPLVLSPRLVISPR